MSYSKIDLEINLNYLIQKLIDRKMMNSEHFSWSISPGAFFLEHFSWSISPGAQSCHSKINSEIDSKLQIKSKINLITDLEIH